MPPPPSAEQVNLEEKISIDLGDEYEQALADATQEEIIDLAGKVKQNQKKKKPREIFNSNSFSFHDFFFFFEWPSLL